MLATLCDVLDCTPTDLIATSAQNLPARRAAGEVGRREGTWTCARPCAPAEWGGAGCVPPCTPPPVPPRGSNPLQEASRFLFLRPGPVRNSPSGPDGWRTVGSPTRGGAAR
ncbi:hypothetical protein ACWCXB_28085 [Streptomyces sp. NPDC001514]